MASSLFDEALADAKKLREVAEQNAKNAIIEAVSPKIKKFIEDQLIGESANDEKNDEKDDDENVLNDVAEIDGGASIKETENGDEEFVLTNETVKSLVDMVLDEDAGKGQPSSNDFGLAEARSAFEKLLESQASNTQIEKLRQLRAIVESAIEKIGSGELNENDTGLIHNDMNALLVSINEAYRRQHAAVFDARFTRLNKIVENAKGLSGQMSNMSVSGKSALTKGCLKMLSEAGELYKIITSLDSVSGKKTGDVTKNVRNLCKEIWTMSKKTGSIMNEEDVLLKLNLPDDIELDLSQVTVDVVPPEGEEGVPLDPAGAMDDPGAADLDVADDVAVAAENVGDAAPGTGPCASCGSGDDVELGDLDDDDVVEISETMLRDELKKMREGKATDPKVIEDFGGGKSEGDPWLDQKVTTEGESSDKDGAISLKPAVTKLQKELAEYKNVVSVLRNQLTETNLFNAKLLYANRVLQSTEFSRGQKIRVIEALDKAKTLREVKLLYKSLTESIGGGKQNGELTESVATKKTVLGSASRPTKPASSVNESVETERWAKLAGLNLKD